MRSYLLIGIGLSLLSCHKTQQERPFQDTLIGKKDTIQIKEPSFENYVPKNLVEEPPGELDHNVPAFPAQWTSLAKIPAHWVGLERDEKGYVVYDPCNGDFPKIVLEKGTVWIKLWVEEPVVLSIDKITRTQGNKGFYCKASNQLSNADIQVEIVDAKRKLVLWQIDLLDKDSDGGIQWRLVMTPELYSKTFRLIKNDCEGMMDFEKGFLPIEY